MGGWVVKMGKKMSKMSKKRSETQILYTPGDFLKESAYWAFGFLHRMQL